MIWAAFRVLSNLLRLVFLPLAWLGWILQRPRSPWVRVDLRDRVVELERPRTAWLHLIPGASKRLPTSLDALRRLFREVARAERVRGILLTIPSMQLGWASAQALRGLVSGLQKAGKRVVVYLPQGGGNHEIFLAVAADRVLLGPGATLAPVGLRASSFYLKGLLDRVGVRVEAFTRREFKTAAEGLTREGMSEAQREQLGALLGVWDAELRRALGRRSRLDDARLERLFAEAIFSGRAAIEAGLVDGVCYEDELPLQLEGAEAPNRRPTRASRYAAWAHHRFLAPIVRPAHIAVIPIRGTISNGRRSADRVIRAIRHVRGDRRALGVILHIDSPGGGALASERIHREVVRLREQKPVVALLGNVAASGGYYIATAAHAIVAQPLTITGSIGVVSAQLVAEGLFERLGVRLETLRTAPHADMGSPARPLDAEERRILEREMDFHYDRFLGHVAEGRRMSVEAVERLARGRVWAGSAAHEHGLVDRLGGMEVALQILAERLPGAFDPARIPLSIPTPRGDEGSDAAPPEVPAAAAALELRIAEALLGPDAPSLVGLLELLRSSRGCLYYAPLLPRID